jgi:hypothetical protein
MGEGLRGDGVGLMNSIFNIFWIMIVALVLPDGFLVASVKSYDYELMYDVSSGLDHRQAGDSLRNCRLEPIIWLFMTNDSAHSNSVVKGI